MERPFLRPVRGEGFVSGPGGGNGSPPIDAVNCASYAALDSSMSKQTRAAANSFISFWHASRWEPDLNERTYEHCRSKAFSMTSKSDSKRGTPQQTVMVRRLFFRRDAQPLEIGIKSGHGWTLPNPRSGGRETRQRSRVLFSVCSSPHAMGTPGFLAQTTNKPCRRRTTMPERLPRAT